MARTFGERFLDEFRRPGGATTAWSPNAIEALKTSDRRGFIAALSKVSSASAKTLVIAAHTAEPETLARRAAKESRDDGADADMQFVLLAITVGRPGTS